MGLRSPESSLEWCWSRSLRMCRVSSDLNPGETILSLGPCSVVSEIEEGCTLLYFTHLSVLGTLGVIKTLRSYRRRETRGP